MKKLTISDITSKNAILAFVFALIYVGLLVTGFGVNGELSPTGANMAAIIVSAILFISFGTKTMEEIENKPETRVC